MIELILTETLPSIWVAAVSSYTLHSLAITYLLWLFYLAVMNLKRAKDNGTLNPVALVLGYPFLIIGLILDLLVNVFVMTFLFLELPRETLVTARLKRLIKEGGWRGKLAYLFCHYLLDTFDPSGSHCK